MKTFKRVRQTLGLVTLFVYSITNTVWALPSPVGIEIMPKKETPAFLNIDIPSDLAQVEEIYEAPPKVDPRLIIHIQNAHGNYEAQLKIKKLLKHLYSTYGFRLFFVEGAVERLNPDYLRLFPDNKHNLDVADQLAREGKLTGAEFFLIDAPSEVQAVGIEQAELYRANVEVFKEVYARQSETDRFTDQVDQRLLDLSAKIFSPELRRLILEWKKFQSGHRAFMPFIEKLSQDARKYLDVDMKDIVSQVEWPQITRLLILQSMEKELNLDEGRKQKDQVVAFLRNHQVPEKVVTALQNLEERHITMNRLDPADEKLENLPRYLLERLVEEAGPKGFKFSDYPDFSLYAGYFILKSEVDSKMLFDEVEALFEQILNKLAVKDQEKLLLALLRDNLTVRKLFHLEVTRENWEAFSQEKQRMEPETLVQRIGKLSSEGAEIKPSKEVLEAFDLALNFYNLARQRESVFYYMIKQGMFKETEDKSALLTGGFHTAGVFERFRKDEVNYGVLMPRIQEEIDNQNYVNAMLDKNPNMFESATVELPASMESGTVLAAKGVDEFAGVVAPQLSTAVQADQKWVSQGINPETDYYDAARFTKVINESRFAALRNIRIQLSPAGDYAYLFYKGQPVRMPNGQFLKIPTVVINNAEDKPVRVFATSISSTEVAPEGYTAPAEGQNAILPPAVEGINEFNLKSVLDKLAAEAAPAPLPPVVTRQDTVKQNVLAALRPTLSARVPGQTPTAPAKFGSDFAQALAQLDLQQELIRTEGNPQERAILLSLISSLAALGSVDSNIGENMATVIAEITRLLQGKQTKLEKAVDQVRQTAPQFVSNEEGHAVILTDKLLNENEIIALASQLALNPALKIFYVFTSPEGEQDVD
ncbi:MAG TPA: hypothetical protein VL688_07705, partial [Verrucomicrobiae bacterium]|nr:hypothetical protein [Verrucomicrobiae bacterium]